MQQLVAEGVEPSLLALPRVDFNPAIGEVLAIRILRTTRSFALTPQLSLDESRGVEVL